MDDIKKSTSYISKKIKDTIINATKDTPVILHALPGTGKTYSIIHDLTLKARVRGEKVLLIVNRKTLREQLINDITAEFGINAKNIDFSKDRSFYTFENLSVMSYQYIADLLSRNHNKSVIRVGNFKSNDYGYMVADEIHYLQNDSTFSNNVDEILRLPQVFSEARRIYMTGTLSPFLRKLILAMEGIIDTEDRGNRDYLLEELSIRSHRYWKKTMPRNIERFYGEDPDDYYPVTVYELEGPSVDYSYITPHFIMPDVDLFSDIMEKLDLEGDNKIIAFVREKKHGRGIREKLVKAGVSTAFIYAAGDSDEELDDESKDAYASIVNSGTFSQRVLLCTTVLYNGVNILDSKISTIYIEDFKYINFMQELARVRVAGSEQKITLIVRRYDADFFEGERKRLCNKLQLANMFDTADDSDKIQLLELEKNQIRKIINRNEYDYHHVSPLSKAVIDEEISEIEEILDYENVSDGFVERVLGWLGLDYNPENDEKKELIKCTRAAVEKFIEDNSLGFPKDKRDTFASELRSLYEAIPDHKVICSNRDDRIPGTNTINKILSEFGVSIKEDNKKKIYTFEKLKEA